MAIYHAQAIQIVAEELRERGTTIGEKSFNISSRSRPVFYSECIIRTILMPHVAYFQLSKHENRLFHYVIAA